MPLPAWQEIFTGRMGKHYGKFETWIFEPHVAEQIFNDYIKEANVPVLISIQHY